MPLLLFMLLALSCHAMPCHAMPCQSLPIQRPFNAQFCPALPCPAMPCHALPCPALPCPAYSLLLLQFSLALCLQPCADIKVLLCAGSVTSVSSSNSEQFNNASSTISMAVSQAFAQVCFLLHLHQMCWHCWYPCCSH